MRKILIGVLPILLVYSSPSWAGKWITTVTAPIANTENNADGKCSLAEAVQLSKKIDPASTSQYKFNECTALYYTTAQPQYNRHEIYVPNLKFLTEVNLGENPFIGVLPATDYFTVNIIGKSTDAGPTTEWTPATSNTITRFLRINTNYTVDLAGLLMKGGRAQGKGGAILHEHGNLKVSNVQFEGNTAT